MRRILSLVTALSLLGAASAAAQNVTLTINLAGPQSGTVGVIPSGLLCSKPGSTSCTVSFAAGTAVRIVANGSSSSPTPPGVFENGTGSAAACGTSTCSFTITTDSTITATFDNTKGPFYRVTITFAGDGQGKIGIDNSNRQNQDPPTAGTSGTDYAANSVVSIGAGAAPESRFSGYSNGTNGAASCGAAANCEFTITANASVTATFHAMTSLAVAPASASLVAGSTRTYTASGTFSNGVTESVSSLAGMGVWRTKANLLSTRHALAAAGAGGKIYAIGGITNALAGGSAGTTVATIESYDPGTNVWTTRASMSVARSGHAAATVGDTIYAIGGNSSGATPLSGVERYDVLGNTWSSGASMPSARRSLAAAVVDGIIYVIGGETSGGVVGTVEAYNPANDTWSTKASLQTARKSLAVIVSDNRIYAVGGIDAGGNAVTTVEAYNPATDTWTSRAALSLARGAHAGASADGLVYVVGGLDPTAFWTNSYDPAVNQWGNRESMITARQDLASVSLGGLIYAIGGRSTTGTTLRNVQAFTDSLRWSSADSSIATIGQSSAQALGVAAGQTTIAASIGAITCAATNACGTLAVTPNQSTVAIDRSSLTFTAVVEAGTVISSSAPATINLGVTGSAPVTWTASPSQPWLSVSPSSGSGSAVINVSIVSNAALPASGAGTATISFQLTGASNTVGPVDVSLTVTPYVSSVTLDRTSLNFGATVDAGTLVSSTAPATIRLGVTGPAPVNWTATPSQPWLSVSPSSGTGAAMINVSIVSNPSLPVSGSASATIAFQLTRASNTVGPINASLAVTPKTGPASPPFGSFDTPAGDSTVLAGSVAVTGWALDNIGIQRVEIWRDLQPGEPTTPFASTPTDPRNGKVFISNATFVEGARPDVEGLNPTTPASYKAGWGYLLLTNGLFGQGNGTYRLHAFAFDQENNVSTIGSKTIVVNNSAAAKPFGTIDTPSMGGDASGPNFGWGLTPRVNGVATCTIQPSGVQYSIDSGPLQPVVYGDARSDIAGAFPGFSNTAAAGGHAIIDWSALTNGVHTIGWLITDDCGRADGVGSRFFTVTTGTNLLAAPVEAGGQRTEVGPVHNFTANPTSDFRPPTSDLRPPTSALVLTRGYNGSAEVLAAEPYIIEIKQNERIELRTPRGYDTAYQLGAGGQVRPLPVGSTWDAASGIFYWQPAPGFLGRYRLVFSNGSERISVRVAVTPSGG